MERRAGQRRRRVLMELGTAEQLTDVPTSGALATADRPPPAKYSSQACSRSQPPLTAFLPVTWPSLLCTGIVPVGIVLGSAAIHYQLEQLSWHVPRSVFDFCDPKNAHSAPGCVVTVQCWVWAFFAWLVLRLRRHRLDDYRGTYRRWWWFVCSATLLAIGRMTNLLQVGHDLFVSLLPQGETYLRMACGAIVTGFCAALGGYYLLEVRECPTGLALGLLAVVLGTTRASVALLAAIGIPLAGDAPVAGFPLDAAIANSIWLSLLFYARHVVQEVEAHHTATSLLADKPTPNKPSYADKAAHTQQDTLASGQDEPTIPSVVSTTAPASRDANPDSFTDRAKLTQSPSEVVGQKPVHSSQRSRSERRRLRRLQKKHAA